MTRPSHLLCLAVPRSALGEDQVCDRNIDILKNKGWRVAEIIDGQNTDNETKYWNTKRAADYLGVRVDTLNRMRLTGDCALAMPSWWTARVIHDPSDIDVWVDANKRSFTHEKNHTMTFLPPSERLHSTCLHVYQTS